MYNKEYNNACLFLLQFSQTSTTNNSKTKLVKIKNDLDVCEYGYV